MNKDQLYGALRTLGAMLLTYLVSSGKLTSDQASTLATAVAQIAPIVGALALVAYGAWKKRDVANALAADKIEGVTVVVDPKVAPAAVVAAASKQSNDIVISTP